MAIAFWKEFDQKIFSLCCSLIEKTYYRILTYW